MHYLVVLGGNFTNDRMLCIADSAEYMKRVPIK